MSMVEVVNGGRSKPEFPRSAIWWLCLRLSVSSVGLAFLLFVPLWFFWERMPTQTPEIDFSLQRVGSPEAEYELALQHASNKPTDYFVVVQSKTQKVDLALWRVDGNGHVIRLPLDINGDETTYSEQLPRNASESYRMGAMYKQHNMNDDSIATGRAEVVVVATGPDLDARAEELEVELGERGLANFAAMGMSPRVAEDMLGNGPDNVWYPVENAVDGEIQKVRAATKKIFGDDRVLVVWHLPPRPVHVEVSLEPRYGQSMSSTEMAFETNEEFKIKVCADQSVQLALLQFTSDGKIHDPPLASGGQKTIELKPNVPCVVPLGGHFGITAPPGTDVMMVVTGLDANDALKNKADLRRKINAKALGRIGIPKSVLVKHRGPIDFRKVDDSAEMKIETIRQICFDLFHEDRILAIWNLPPELAESNDTTEPSND